MDGDQSDCELFFIVFLLPVHSIQLQLQYNGGDRPGDISRMQMHPDNVTIQVDFLNIDRSIGDFTKDRDRSHFPSGLKYN